MPSPDTAVGAWHTAQDIRAVRVTSVEVVTRSLARIHELQPALNAFTVVLEESAPAPLSSERTRPDDEVEGVVVGYAKLSRSRSRRSIMC
jgi:Asp-tRNA(Asn)/Glu-tRNA(Gln) amidotransferase A subunit family amidase